MKFHANILSALLAINHASSFMVQEPTRKGDMSLQSSFLVPNGGSPSAGASTTMPPPPPSAGAANAAAVERRVDSRSLHDIWEDSVPSTVQGGSLRTWSFDSPAVQRVQVMMKTDGRPLNSNLDLWHGPDNTPQRLQIYVEDGGARPFCAVIETPRGSNVIAVRNTGHLEFPMYSTVSVGESVGNGADFVLPRKGGPANKLVQGGAIFTTPFDPEVAAVRILLKTDGRPLKARLELLQGPNNNKQVIDVYCEDGFERPFYAVIETPGVGNVVRIVNTATVEFPLTASVEPYRIEAFDLESYGRPDQDWSTPRGSF